MTSLKSLSSIESVLDKIADENERGEVYRILYGNMPQLVPLENSGIICLFCSFCLFFLLFKFSSIDQRCGSGFEK